MRIYGETPRLASNQVSQRQHVSIATLHRVGIVGKPALLQIQRFTDAISSRSASGRLISATQALNREAPSLTRMLKPRKPKLSAAQLFYSANKPHQLLEKLIAVQSSALFAKEQPTCCICNIQRSMLRFTVKRLRKNCPRKVESDNWSVC